MFLLLSGFTLCVGHSVGFHRRLIHQSFQCPKWVERIMIAIPTMGESWHCNHHAFPASARHGLYPGQADPGFRFVQLLEWAGLAWDVRVPANLPPRSAITPLTPRALSIAAPGQEALSREWNGKGLT